MKYYFDGITEMGCVIQNACVLLDNNHLATLNLVEAAEYVVARIREEGYVSYRAPFMAKFVKV